MNNDRNELEITAMKVRGMRRCAWGHPRHSHEDEGRKEKNNIQQRRNE